MKRNFGISALVVLLATCNPSRALFAQQPAASTAQRPAVQQPPAYATRRAPKDPFADRLANAHTASRPGVPAPIVKPVPAVPAVTQQTGANVAVAQAPAAAQAGAAAAPTPDAPALKVDCSGGKMSISANNTTLGNVLNEVKRCSGAQVDAPASSYSMRIFDNLGPGPIREVLESLLGDTGFDYVIGASDTHPDKVESILLMARTTEPGSIAGNAAGEEPGSSAKRKAFAERREASRPHPPEEQAQAIAAIESGETPSTAADAPAATSNASATADSNSAPNATERGGPNGPPAPQQSPSASSDTAGSSSPTGANAPSPSDNTVRGERGQPTTDEQITNMEQLFQQRQKMMQPAPPKPE